MIPRIYVVDSKALAAWEAPGAFTLTFEQASQFIHDLQNAMFDQRHLSGNTGLEFFILVIQKKE